MAKQTKKDFETKEMVVALFIHSRNWRRQFEDKWTIFYELYRAHREEKEDKSASNLHIPKPYEVIEVATANTFTSLFAKRPYANFRGRLPGTTRGASITTEFIDYQLNELMTFLPEAHRYIKSFNVYGTSFAKLSWEKRMGEVRYRDTGPEPTPLSEIPPEAPEVQPPGMPGMPGMPPGMSTGMPPDPMSTGMPPDPMSTGMPPNGMPPDPMSTGMPPGMPPEGGMAEEGPPPLGPLPFGLGNEPQDTSSGLYDSAMGVDEEKEYRKEVPIVNNPLFEVISIWDAYPHPDEVAGLRKKLPFIHRKMVPHSFLDRLKVPQYKNIAQVKKMGNWDTKTETTEKPAQASMGEISATPLPTDPQCELLECYYDYGRRIIVIANREIVIRDESEAFFHNQMPIFSTVYCEDPEASVYGISALAPPESLFFELISVRNQRMDNVSLALNAPLVADVNRLENPESVVFARDAIIEVNGEPGKVIQKLEIPDFTRSAQEEEMIIKSDIQASTGITDYSKGMGAEGISNETATGISLLLEQTSKRLTPVVTMCQETWLKPMLEQMKHLNHQFLNQEDYPVADQIQTAHYSHFRPSYDIECTGSTAYLSKTLRFQQVMMLIEKTTGSPYIKQAALFSELLEMGEFKNIDEILEPNPQPAPKEEPKEIITIRVDTTPEQSAQVLANMGVKTSQEDLAAQNIEKLDDRVAKNMKNQRIMDPNQGRGPVDSAASSSKRSGV